MIHTEAIFKLLIDDVRTIRMHAVAIARRPPAWLFLISLVTYRPAHLKKSRAMAKRHC